MINENALLEARKIIAGFLKQRRQELNYSQAFLAEKTGLGLRTIIRAEQAEFWLGMKQFILICEALYLFPAIAEMESDTDIAKALRQNWKINKKEMTLQEAIKMKSAGYKKENIIN